jgi:hypothetical protein
MKTAVRLVLFAALAALGFWLWMVMFPTAEKVILKRMASLASTATFNASDSNINRASKAASLVAYFSEQAEIIIDVPGWGSRTLGNKDEIREAAYGGFAALPGLKVSFLDTTVRVGADKATAEVSCTARIFVGNDKDYGVQEIHFKLKKTDGNWLITRVETVKTLS